jgi:RNA polymerase sigma-70 factor, ECF subfamily
MESNREAVSAIGERPGIEDVRAHAFRALVDDYLTEAYRLAAAILRDPGEAEDATHDALVRAWARWPQLRDRERAEAWFQSILVNECRERLRRRGRRLHEIAVPPEQAAREPLGYEERDALRRGLGDLNPDQRVVLVLRFYLDLEVDEIARRTGARAGTVKSRLHHGLRALRAAYEAAQR